MRIAVPDEIRKTMEIEAPIDRVWEALTTPDGLLGWFPTERADIELRPGGTLRLEWAEDADEGVVETVDPPTHLVFRWRPSGSDRPYTTVSVSLDELGGRTRLTLVETGFASLPDELRERSWHGNDRGWSEELAELKAFLEAA